MTDLETTLLRVLAGQSNGYLLHPNCSAVVAENVTAEDAGTTLDSLLLQGLARVDQVLAMTYSEDGDSIVEAHDDNGEPIVIDQGYVITDAGRTALGSGQDD